LIHHDFDRNSFILIFADHAHWIDPTIWVIGDDKDSKRKFVIYENTFIIVINTIRLLQSTVTYWAAINLAVGEEAESGHVRKLHLAGWVERNHDGSWICNMIKGA
jgi:hypothetical protein